MFVCVFMRKCVYLLACASVCGARVGAGDRYGGKGRVGRIDQARSFSINNLEPERGIFSVCSKTTCICVFVCLCVYVFASVYEYFGSKARFAESIWPGASQ